MKKYIYLVCIVVIILISAQKLVFNQKSNSQLSVKSTTMQHSANSTTWPNEIGVISIQLYKFSKMSDGKAKKMVLLESPDKINNFFKELLKVPAEGGGMMVSFTPDVSGITIEIMYSNDRYENIRIIDGMLQSRDTSFYTNTEDVEKSDIFVKYIEGLI